jgi:NADPH2:quinone reductase
LKVVDEPDLVAGIGQVVVDVAAAGVDYVDALIIAGQYQVKLQPPFTPGTELAGTVSAVGDGVEQFAVGDRVVATNWAGFASQAVITLGEDAAMNEALTKIPDNLDFDRAAVLTQSYCTMWFAFTQRMRLEPGQKVLVLGAGGGIGLATIDVARSFGAEVIAAASTDEKLDAARAEGATHTINYTTEDLKTRAKELGVDVVVDPIGGDMAEAALRAAGWMSTYVVIGFASGGIPRFPLNLALLNNRSIVGVDWGAWSGGDAAGQSAVLHEVMDAVSDGRLRPQAPHRRPLDDVSVVLQEALDRQLVGKTVLIP